MPNSFLYYALVVAVSKQDKTVQLAVEGRRGKTGELNLTFDGMTVQMSKFPKKTRSPSSSSNGNITELEF